MLRNLDVTALRSFVMVADTGGVTRAAARLSLTQSTVSMQMKRLEEMLGQSLFNRAGRGVVLSNSGEQLLSYARRMLELNDEIVARCFDDAMAGELSLGVPHDIIYPHIPRVLQAFAETCPRVRVQLESSYTRKLKHQFDAGEIDLILTTEDRPDRGGETLQEPELIWVGAPEGRAWRKRPVPLAFENNCLFRGPTLKALDRAKVPWTMAVNSDNTRTIEATVSADLAIHVSLETLLPRYLQPIRHNGALPPLPRMQINLYAATGPKSELIAALAEVIRGAFAQRARRAAE